VQVGAPDESLIRFSGLAAVTELTGRLGIIGKLDDAVGPIKDRDRGFSAGQVLVGMAAAQLCGEDFLVGLDRHRADRAGQALTPVAGLASTTAAGLARRLVEGQWAAVETGLGDVHAAALDLLAQTAPGRAQELCSEVTIDLDTTDVEVYGRLKQGVAFNHQGQRVGRLHVATWADAAVVLAADLGEGRDDPRATSAELLGRALAALPAAARAGADPGARRRWLLRRAARPRLPVHQRRVRDRRPAHRTAVAPARRRPHRQLDRRDQHDQCPGRRGRVLPGLVARSDPAADPPGPARFGPGPGLW